MNQKIIDKYEIVVNIEFDRHGSGGYDITLTGMECSRVDIEDADPSKLVKSLDEGINQLVGNIECKNIINTCLKTLRGLNRLDEVLRPILEQVVSDYYKEHKKPPMPSEALKSAMRKASKKINDGLKHLDNGVVND